MEDKLVPTRAEVEERQALESTGTTTCRTCLHFNGKGSRGKCSFGHFKQNGKSPEDLEVISNQECQHNPSIWRSCRTPRKRPHDGDGGGGHDK